MTKKFDRVRFDYDRMKNDLWNKGKSHQDAVDSLRQSIEDLREAIASMISTKITPEAARSADKRFHRKMWFDGIMMVSGFCVVSYVMVTTILSVI